METPAYQLGVRRLYSFLQTSDSKVFLACFTVPTVCCALSGLVVAKSVKTWYRDLKKPWFNLKRHWFRIAWACLYSCMGISSYLVVSDKRNSPWQKPAIALYALQFLASLCFCPVFFIKNDLALSSLLTGALFQISGYTTLAFYQVRPLAGLLNLPFYGFSAVACTITTIVWKLNDSPKTAE